MANDYARNDPKGWCGNPSRGAAMGRPSIEADPATFTGRLLVSRERLDSGGYDRNGTYCGHGAPLYWVRTADDTEDSGGNPIEVDYMVRAGDRDGARRQVLRKYPLAKVRR